MPIPCLHRPAVRLLLHALLDLFLVMAAQQNKQEQPDQLSVRLRLQDMAFNGGCGRPMPRLSEMFDEMYVHCFFVLLLKGVVF